MHSGFVEYYDWYTPQRWILINPIIDWTVAEVWSYIYHYRLPVMTPYRNITRPDTPLQHLVFVVGENYVEFEIKACLRQ